jgi:nitric oxide reductase NorE protein
MSLLASRALRSRRRPPGETHLPGEAGVWVLLFGDMAFFGLLFVAFLYYRSREPALFAASQAHLDVNLGAVNTLVLLTSSILVVTGVRAVRHGAAHLATPLFGGAVACGVVFGVDKYVEYSAKLAVGITPATNSFYMIYYILTGLHMVHVLTGMAVLLFMIAQSRKPAITIRQFGYVEGGACFWHMVDLLWIVLFPLVYLVRT